MDMSGFQADPEKKKINKLEGFSMVINTRLTRTQYQNMTKCSIGMIPDIVYGIELWFESLLWSYQKFFKLKKMDSNDKGCFVFKHKNIGQPATAATQANLCLLDAVELQDNSLRL